MKKRNHFKILLLILVSSSVFACSKLNKVTDVITQPSAREVYKREFKKRPAVFSRWNAEFIQAQNDSLQVNLPYAEVGQFTSQLSQIYAYEVTLQNGTIFTAEVEKDSLGYRVFIDIFQQLGSALKHLESNQPKENTISFHPKQTGTYKIIIQPEIAAQTPFFISLSEKPAYHFPVAGKGNTAIQSFWGNARDGGKRSHEGIDIFAKRGTPVIAAVDGRVSRTGNRGLGGKQVWLREGMFGNSLYYAHLDSIIAQQGQQVKVGDTLGLIGNTGNAKTTPPHLHFGIYRGGTINPLPFVFETEKIQRENITSAFTDNFLVIKSAKANLRQGPDTSYDKIEESKKDDTLQLLGSHHNWLHVQTSANKRVYIHSSLVAPLN